MVTGNPVVKEPRYFNIFKCGKNILNNIDVKYELESMANSRDKYNTELLRTIIYYNKRNYAPLSNERILEAINKLTAEEELDSHNITSYSHNVIADTFSQTSNTQIENANAILTSEDLNKSDKLVETLEDLTINDAEYYVSDSANANDTK